MTVDLAKQLQTELETIVRQAVDNFENQTGLTVTNLYVFEHSKGSDKHVQANTILRENRVEAAIA